MNPWKLLFEQLRNVLILILLVAVGLSAALGHATEAIVITIIVLFAVVLGFVQEYKAERAIEALQGMAAPTATVLRDGHAVDVPARELVPGDVMLLEAGDRAPADGRVFEAVSLQVEEAALTGESVPVEKQTGALPDRDLSVGDRRNLVYAGTTVTYGHGRALAVATGMNTEFGGIAQLLQTVERSRTPLQLSLDRVGMTLARVAIVLVLLVVSLGLVRGQSFVEMLLFGAALAVAVVPEALPAVITISLTLAAQRMVKRNALVRRLAATETLGSVSVICSDKTGTLTKDEMTVRKVFVAGELFEVSGAGYEPEGEYSRDGSAVDRPAALIETLRAAVLASDAQLERDADGQWVVRGDPTEGALVVAAAKAGVEKGRVDAEFPRVDEIPFSSETKRITTLHETPGGVVAYAKGAPEVILDTCVRRLSPEGEVALEDDDREAVLATAQELAGEALRVLAVARRSQATRDNAEHDMTFLGLVGLLDPPRPEAEEAVRTCEKAGIKAVMITGDHPVTAQAIARELGVLTTGRTVTGSELEAMDDAELRRAVEEIEVYARVAPAHKLRVVSAFQDNGHYVAMTGDGVNDAPALKKADIGVAMGITGTDVTKEAAAMMLTDDNFASIVSAIEEGRRVFANIKKYLMYLLAANLGEIVLLVGVSLLGWPLPLSAVQILYINLATDGLPALALAVDPPERNIMRRPPRAHGTGIFTRPVLSLIVVGGVGSAAITFGLFSWLLSTDRPLAEAMTMTFVTLVLVEFFKAYSFRSERSSVLDRPFANKWLNRAIVWELLMLALVLSVPFLSDAFGTTSLALGDWLLVVGLAFLIVPVLETAKLVIRRRTPAEMAS
ncbi:MAG: ATPase, P-type (transporting), HAD superfamily, subfamily IC [uncultured Solirubrobacteraceae bacterium]|uniref:Probable cation-transporting ATPase F n=1 Tax=uncultured Solirubrobacteraceae bacterium TaxID=1162706 RepID=A0A6J4RP30_9ACTN|nr:MAG: ATPase, P-type (transporting), HAD superfamily, subfamily IC [uncultured Solirubrobacteraceae bacterium]